MGLNVKDTAVPVEGFKVIPVIPTLAEMIDTFDKASDGLDVMVTARCAVPPPPPPPPPRLLFGTPLQPAKAIMATNKTNRRAALRFIPHPKVDLPDYTKG